MSPGGTESDKTGGCSFSGSGLHNYNNDWQTIADDLFYWSIIYFPIFYTWIMA